MHMSFNFEQFCQTIALLRGPDGCPWDRQQTSKSLTRYLLEETYEVLDAINGDDFDKLKDELGDLLLQVVLQAQLGAEKGHFNIEDVVQSINKKMIARHPHVFSEKELKTTDAVKNQWEEIKEAERALTAPNTIGDTSVLTDIPLAMPALLKALKISEKAASQGFEWEKEDDIWKQLDSEIEEFKQEVENNQAQTLQITVVNDQNERKSSIAYKNLCLEMGDILFTIVNIARWYKIDPEGALLLTVDKFKKRFQLMEKKANSSLRDLTIDQWADLWGKAKKDILNDVQ